MGRTRSHCGVASRGGPYQQDRRLISSLQDHYGYTDPVEVRSDNDSLLRLGAKHPGFKRF